ncbi:VMAP-C domain-containing protein [Streptomyces sp. NPDC003691]
MGWFLRGTPETTKDPLGCLASIRRDDDGKTAGGGLFLAPDTVLTCAHVINDALGRAMFETRVPGPVEIALTVPGPRGGRDTCTARVAHWIPPRPRKGSGPVPPGAREWLGDLAVLRFPPPSTDGGRKTTVGRGPALEEMEAGQQVRLWHGTARPGTFADATVGHVGPDIGYVDGAATGMAVDRGFSGGPLWSKDDTAFVGLVVAHYMPPPGPDGGPEAYSPQHLVRRSWCIPWQRIEAELRAVGALPPARPAAVEKDDPAAVLLSQALYDLMPSANSRAEHGARLAKIFGLRVPSQIMAPSAEEFAEFLLREPRALAAFSETTRHTDPGSTDRLLAAGALSPVPRLLSPEEHRRLHRLLHETETPVRSRFAEAARAALPMAAPLRPQWVRGPLPEQGPEPGPGPEGGTGYDCAVPGAAEDVRPHGPHGPREPQPPDGAPGPHGSRGSRDSHGTQDSPGQEADPAGWTPTLDELIDHLETLHGDSRSDGYGPRVPALLRVVEYLAVLCSAPQCARFRIWSDSVAVRLGIPRSALGERRIDAKEWQRAMRGRRARVRVLVQVTRQDLERYRLRIWCDEGAGPRQVSASAAVPYTGPEAARELLRVLESLDPASVAEQQPMVEVLVDPSGLNLPIDEWEGMGPGDLVPGMLGAEFPLVVNCPELLRRHERFLPEWRRRWQQLDSGTTLVFSDGGLGRREIYGTLMERLDAVRVSVEVPAGLRDEIVQLCLAVGVPVVMWDRKGGETSHAAGQMARVATRELPEGVRSYRAKTMYLPREYPGRPVLAWADADRTVPRLHLSEPVESA